MFFNIANLDTKSMVAILGQDFSLVVTFFGFPTLFCLPIPFGTFRHLPVLLLSFVLLQKDDRHGAHKLSRTYRSKSSGSSAGLWASLVRCTFPVAVRHVNWPSTNSSRPIQFAFRAPCRSFEGIWTCPLLYVMVCTIRRASSSPFHQEVHVVLHHLHAARSAHTSPCQHIGEGRRHRLTLTGLDTSGSVVHFSMNFVDQMSTRHSTTSSKTNTPSWFSPRTRCQDHHSLIYLYLWGSNPSRYLEPRRSSGIHPFLLPLQTSSRARTFLFVEFPDSGLCWGVSQINSLCIKLQCGSQTCIPQQITAKTRVKGFMDSTTG